jgi:hypothetical protein
VPIRGHEAARLALERLQAAIVLLDDVGMNRLVRQLDEERAVRRPIDEALNVVGEQVGRVRVPFSYTRFPSTLSDGSIASPWPRIATR